MKIHNRTMHMFLAVVVILILAVVAILILGVGTATGEDSVITVKPEVSTDPVVNPGKGWVSYKDPDEISPEELSLISVGYDRFEWGLIQPDGEGQFDWTVIDNFIAGYAAHGKQVAFGVMVANTHARVEGGYVTPKWVFEAGVPKGTKFIGGGDPAKGRPGTYYHPKNFNDPVFLEKFGAFLKAMAERYDGHPDIAFIDIRSFQNWGEGMSWDHVDLHAKYFSKTRLCQSTHGGGAAKRAKQLAERGIAVRRDGIGGSKGEEVAPAAGLAPAIFEFWYNVPYLKKRGWWKEGQLIPQAVEIGKPTYVEFIRGSQKELLDEYRAVVDEVTNRIGFHFVLNTIAYPKQVTLGVPATINLTWTNTGVSKIFVTCLPKVALVDKEGKIVNASALDGSAPENWLPEKQVTETAKVVFPDKNLHGSYRLAIGLFESDTAPTPGFRLGIETPVVNGWHILGDVRVVGSGN